MSDSMVLVWLLLWAVFAWGAMCIDDLTLYSRRKGTFARLFYKVIDSFNSIKFF